MVDGYLQQAMRCRTVNEFNRLHITLENILAPTEVEALVRGVRQRVTSMPAPVADWFGRLEQSIGLGKLAVQPYVRRPIANGAIRYAAPGRDAERSQRTLVIAFTGDANRLMMPLAMFLQHCPADRYEFVVLFDGTQRLYMNGVDGLGATLPETIDAIARHAKPAFYRRTVSFGTSAGGLAALWTGIALETTRAVSVGGVTPSLADERSGEDAAASRSHDEAFEALVRERAGRLPEIVLVAGELNARDTEKAHEMGERLPARHLTIPGARAHNMLYEVWLRGELDAWLDRLLGEGTA
jgi:hypothetical protein